MAHSFNPEELPSAVKARCAAIRENPWLGVAPRVPRVAPPPWGEEPMPPPPALPVAAPSLVVCTRCMRHGLVACAHAKLPRWNGAGKIMAIKFHYNDDEPRPRHFEARAAHRRKVYAILAFVLPLRITLQRYEEASTDWRQCFRRERLGRPAAAAR